MIKILEAVPCLNLFNLLNNMLSNRYFQVFLGDQSTRWRRLNNRLPQGSVLAPILFNLYMSDLPSTAAKVLQYVFDECENTLEADIEVLNQFFHRWCLQPNPGKTEMYVFHLHTHAANKQLDVMFNGTSIKHVDQPKYLGATLDWTLTYKSHLEKAAKKQKVSSRVNLVCKLAGMKCGLNTQTLRTASLALVYSSAEYCAPVLLNSAHVHKLDVQLNNVMRLFTGTVKSTELQWLPVLSNITPPKLRREAALFRELKL
jgi:hypothetical protein